ncbi:hypothetical protein FLA_1488 [Filimonas lacunae]|nr:hypothetical protein FLA_1488 [Filimonas lacunae]
MLLLQDCFDDVRKKLDAAGCRSLKVPDIQLAKEKMGLCRRLHSLAQYWKGRDKTTADAVLMPMKKILYGRDTRDFTYEVLEYIQHIFPVLEQAIRQAKSDDEIVQLLLDHNFNHPEILFLHEQQLDAELADMSNNKKIAHLERQLKMVKSGLFTYKGALLPGGKSARKMKKKRYKKLKDYYSHLEQVAWDAASATAGMPSFEPLVWNMSTREFAAFCKMWKECEVFKNKDFIAILRTLLLVSRFSDTKEPPKADHVNNLAKQLSFPTHTKLSRLVQDSKSYLNSRSMRAKKE